MNLCHNDITRDDQAVDVDDDPNSMISTAPDDRHSNDGLTFNHHHTECELEEREHDGSDDDDVDDEEEGDDDEFNHEGIPMPRLTSSTIPIVVDVSNRHRHAGFYSSNDPLFQGVCLYSTSNAGNISRNNKGDDCNDKDILGQGNNHDCQPQIVEESNDSRLNDCAKSHHESAGGSILSTPSAILSSSSEELDHWFIPSVVFRFLLRSR